MYGISILVMFMIPIEYLFWNSGVSIFLDSSISLDSPLVSTNGVLKLGPFSRMSWRWLCLIWKSLVLHRLLCFLILKWYLECLSWLLDIIDRWIGAKWWTVQCLFGVVAVCIVDCVSCVLDFLVVCTWTGSWLTVGMKNAWKITYV